MRADRVVDWATCRVQLLAQRHPRVILRPWLVGDVPRGKVCRPGRGAAEVDLQVVDLPVVGVRLSVELVVAHAAGPTAGVKGDVGINAKHKALCVQLVRQPAHPVRVLLGIGQNLAGGLVAVVGEAPRVDVHVPVAQLGEPRRNQRISNLERDGLVDAEGEVVPGRPRHGRRLAEPVRHGRCRAEQ